MGQTEYGTPAEQREHRTCCADYPHICPGCQRVMSHREWDEQRACNECAEGWRQ